MKIVIYMSLCLLVAVSTISSVGCRSETAQGNQSGNSNSTTSDWHEHTTSNGKMKISFPTKPNVELSNQPSAIGTLKMEIINCEVGKNMAFTANSIIFPVDPSEYDAEAGLKGAIDSQRADNEVLSETDISKNGLLGTELVIKNSAGLFLKARCFIDGSGPTMYQVNVAANSKAAIESDEATRFLDSMDIME